MRKRFNCDNIFFLLTIFFLGQCFHLTTSQNISGKDWWETQVFYQIYPRSYRDSNGDGIGDLKGITNNMQHFVDSGVGVIWLSPIYKSPMVDFGYDISDFRDIQPDYGTLQDFDDMVARAHESGLRVVLDFVPNHASNESDYFKLSLNRTSGYEDFFIWDDGIPDPDNSSNRLPPSNWVSLFQGSAWEWREERQQFYLHQFSIQQPDFNYRNPAVRDELRSILRFWLDRGVDGFRVDACPYFVEADKDANGRYPDDPLSGTPGIGPGELGYVLPYNTKDLDESYDIIYDWKDFLTDYARSINNVTRVMMTEGYANISRTMKYYGSNGREGSDIPFNFDFITEVNGNSSARDFVYTALRRLTYMPNNETANWVFGNHDNSRMATRFGPRNVDGLNMLDLILPGVAITYQGDEIGMEDGYVSYEDTVDVQGCNAGRQNYAKFSRDPERTPFQWDDTSNAGFTTGNRTWLPVAQNYRTLNLQNQMNSDRSHFKVYQSLTDLRRNPTIRDGNWDIKPLSDNVFGVERFQDVGDVFLMLMNLANQSDTVSPSSEFRELPSLMYVRIASVNSTRNVGDPVTTNSVTMQPAESLVLSNNPVGGGGPTRPTPRTNNASDDESSNDRSSNDGSSNDGSSGDK